MTSLHDDTVNVIAVYILVFRHLVGSASWWVSKCVV